MEAKDFLFRIKNDFYLGRHLEVLEGFKDYKSSAAFKKQRVPHFEIVVFLQKTLVFFLRNCEDVVRQNESLFADLASWLDLFLKYHAPVLMPLQQDEGEQLLAELRAESNALGASNEEFALLKTCLANDILAAQRRFSSMTEVPLGYKETYFQHQTSVFCAFESNRQFREADRVIEDLRLADDDHVLVALLSVRREARLGNGQRALALLADAREKFGDAPKLSNLQAGCLMLMGRYAEVF